MSRMRARYTGHRINQAQMRAVLGGAPGGVSADLDARAARVLAAARTLVGVRTGTLLTSIRVERGRGPHGERADIVAGVPGITTYLGFHHDGTGPHIIRPRRRKALRFIAGGQVVFARKVNHPGSAGTRFLTDALRAAR